jgi:hypothetical protein
MLTKACSATIIANPTPKQRAEADPREQCDPQPPPGDDAERDQNRGRADESDLLADDGEDEIVVRLGQEEELLHAVPEPESEHAARSNRDLRLQELVTLAQWTAGGIHEGENAQHAIRLEGNEIREHRQHQQADAREIAPAEDPPRKSSRGARTSIAGVPRSGWSTMISARPPATMATGSSAFWISLMPVHPPLEHCGGEDDGDDLPSRIRMAASWAANQRSSGALRYGRGTETRRAGQRPSLEHRPDDLRPSEHVIVDAHHDEQRHRPINAHGNWRRKTS